MTLLILVQWSIKKSSGFSPGLLTVGIPVPSMPVIVEPAFRQSNIVQIASGEATHASLVKAVAIAVDESSPLPGDGRVSVGWADPAGSVMRGWSFGWPQPLVHLSRQRAYHDAIARQGEMVCYTDPSFTPKYWFADTLPRVPKRPRAELGWVTAFYPPPESTRGVLVELAVDFTALAPIGVVVLAATWMSARAISVLRRLVPTLDRGALGRRLARRSAPFLLGALLWCGLSLVTASSERQPLVPDLYKVLAGVSSGSVSPTHASISAIPELFSTFAENPSDADGSRNLARAILDATARASLATEGRYLGIAVRSEADFAPGTDSTDYPGYRQPFVSTKEAYFRRNPEFGPATPIDVPRKFSTDWATTVSWSTGERGGALHKVIVHPLPVSLTILGLIAIWHAVRLPAWRSIRADRRRARGQCVGCGYPVGVPTPAPLSRAT